MKATGGSRGFAQVQRPRGGQVVKALGFAEVVRVLAEEVHPELQSAEPKQLSGNVDGSDVAAPVHGGIQNRLAPQNVLVRARKRVHCLPRGQHLQQVALDGVRRGRQPPGHAVGAPGPALGVGGVHGVAVREVRGPGAPLHVRSCPHTIAVGAPVEDAAVVVCPICQPAILEHVKEGSIRVDHVDCVVGQLHNVRWPIRQNGVAVNHHVGM
mmetsp:Transcript_81280/g.195041  ORF Transcript_81280/g.195041 Transcript_81280/m.195041 type:complete len:211 (+) Transcript_81280:250-882(+)